MDPASILIFLVFMIPITVIILKSALGKAIADRIAGRTGGEDRRMLAEIDALRHELDQVHEQLLEVNERLDFSERLLAQQREGFTTPPEGVAR